MWIFDYNRNPNKQGICKKLAYFGFNFDRKSTFCFWVAIGGSLTVNDGTRSGSRTMRDFVGLFGFPITNALTKIHFLTFIFSAMGFVNKVILPLPFCKATNPKPFSKFQDIS